MLVVRLMCVAYVVLLTVALLVSNPFELLGVSSVPGATLSVAQHFLSFTILALLVHISRFRIRPHVLAGLLIGYAVATESLQWLVPDRTVQLRDYVENLLGLAEMFVVSGKRNASSSPRTSLSDISGTGRSL